MTHAKGQPRALYAAALLVVLLAALLGGWFVSGWSDVRRQQHEIVEAPRLAAEQRATELARELHTELEALIAREVGRPYFHYQNLMHDPNASAGDNVSPSPLARGTDDPLVLGYFQLDAKGTATTPTINDDVPELSEPERLADHERFRGYIARDLSREITPAVAALASAAARPTRAARPRPRAVPSAQAPTQRARVETPSIAPPPSDAAASQIAATPQIVAVPQTVYSQNQMPNTLYKQSQGLVQPIGAPPASPLPEPSEPPAPVYITISPLEWRTLPYDGAPALVAIRNVQTPDGAFAQGFVVDRAKLASWLAARTSDMTADLQASEAHGVAVAPGWALSVTPGRSALTMASTEADAVRSAFVRRFVGVGSLAFAACGCVLFFLMRAESLARERSQFAAAAAHELRTPLAGLQLYGDMLADGLGDPTKTRDYARRISEDAARLGRVVSNMLGFSQLERGHLTLDVKVGSISDLLRELVERAQPSLERAGAVMFADIGVDLIARFDHDAVVRIIGNLIDNAEKYGGRAGENRIDVSAAERGGNIEIRVEDRGPGIADSTRLFRAFSRGSHAGDGVPGLGLGLALSRSLARAMDGDLVYQPRHGGGSTFLLRLPRA